MIGLNLFYILILKNMNISKYSMYSELHDLHPKTWLSPFRRTSSLYLFKMALFYSALSLGLMQVGSYFATNLISGYDIPQFPVSILLALSSGLLEESVFFGIPYYISGSSIALLGTGIIWSASHLFNSGIISIETVSYGGFLFSIPHIFFSIRTWMSKKGWFAIVFHSGWNVSILSLYCALGLRQCSIINDVFDISNFMMAASSGIIVYLAYQNKKRNINKLFYVGPILVMFFAFILFLNDFF